MYNERCVKWKIGDFNENIVHDETCYHKYQKQSMLKNTSSLENYNVIKRFGAHACKNQFITKYRYFSLSRKEIFYGLFKLQ